MAYLTCQFVRPDRLVYEGEAASIILATPTGEMGIWPGHTPAVVALGDGVVRLNRRDEDGGGTYKVIVSGGYAEIDDDTVIVLATHGRRIDDIEPAVVRATKENAQTELKALAEDDHRRAYWESKINWCNLLLQNAEEDTQRKR